MKKVILTRLSLLTAPGMRTDLLTSGMVIGGVMALHTGKPFETNDMAVAYQAPKASLFWQT